MAGETTSLSATAWRDSQVLPVLKGPTLHVHEVTATYSNTNQLELNDVMQVTYLPPGVKIWALGVTATDMDSSTGLVQKVTVGSTDIVTGLTNGQTAATTFHQLPAAYTTTNIELVTITNTTAASGTPATGSVLLRFYYTAP
jgi:hypothetical protein